MGSINKASFKTERRAFNSQNFAATVSFMEPDQREKILLSHFLIHRRLVSQQPQIGEDISVISADSKEHISTSSLSKENLFMSHDSESSQVRGHHIANLNTDQGHGAENIPCISSLRERFKNISNFKFSSWGGLQLGLRGGGDSSIGTSGWGPPPSGNHASASGGWGNTPSNPVASAAWSTPNPISQVNPSIEDTPNKSGAVSSSPAALVTSTSWAAAAGKGLPPNESLVISSSVPSKQLEQLHSVREALFSQDGWGGSFVKQDTSWDVGGGSSPDSSASPYKDSASSGPPLSNTWNSSSLNGGGNVGSNSAPRNDGTDLWKVNLSGQPLASKPGPSNPWGHTPQNPTDFKNWGEDEEHQQQQQQHQQQHHTPSTTTHHHQNNEPSSSSSSFWRPETTRSGSEHSQQFTQQQQHQQTPLHNGPSSLVPAFGPSKKDDWTSGPANWSTSESRRPELISRDGWNNGSSGSPNRPVYTQWGNSSTAAVNNNSNVIRDSSSSSSGGGGSSNGGTIGNRPSGWGGTPADPNDSPTLIRRTPAPLASSDDGGTSLWSKAPPGTPLCTGDRLDRGNVTSNVTSNWQDMPTPMRSGGQSVRGLPMSKEPWSHVRTGWSDEHSLKVHERGWNEQQQQIQQSPATAQQQQQMDSGLNKGRDNGNWSLVSNPSHCEHNWQSRMTSSSSRPIRVSPNWEDGGEWNKASRHPLTKEIIWNSKQFRMLADMNFNKNDIEGALRQSNMGLEDALDILRYHGSSRSDSLFASDSMGFEGLTRRFPGSLHSHEPPSPHLLVPKLMSTPPRGPSSQPSAQQLRILVQQIQMAVSAGHLNPQILNQPLAPQTLILLNQLLQQIKNLQGLQLASSGKGPLNSSSSLLQVSVNITKTKQAIVNLQNQISAQQANYLKTQSLGGPCSDSDVSNMFSVLNLGSNESLNGGSRLSVWKLPEESFIKAPGSKGASGSGLPNSSPNLLLNDEGPWSNSSNQSGGGWPEKSSHETSNLNGGVLDNFGIPEFEPGKPWKGPGLKNPDEDPTLTPGSVASPSSLLYDSSKSTPLDNSLGLNSPNWTFGKSESKVGEWNSGLTPMGQDLWGKGGRCPPPGLVNTSWPLNSEKQQQQMQQHSSAHWSSGQNGSSDSPYWLLLKNLTAQIDGSTLKTLCLQHGPLKHFHLYLNHGLALVKYNSGREAAKAQKALNNCLLGNTTIMATSGSDNEIAQFLNSLGGTGGSTLSAPPPVTSSAILSKSNSMSDMWGPISSSSVVTSTYGSSSAGSVVWGAPNSEDRSTPLQSYLPGDLDLDLTRQ